MAPSFASADASTCYSSANGLDFRSSFRSREAKQLSTVFPDAVCKMLVNVGVTASDIAEERSRMSELVVRPDEESQPPWALLNDFAFMAQAG